MTARRQRLLVAIFTAVALMRGMWWVVTTPIWSPIDEQAHYDYAQALGRQEGIPVVGETRVHRDVLAVAKASPTSAWQSVPVPADPARHEWGALAHSYEAAQPPLYYAVMAPIWRAGVALGTVAAVYVLRVASLLISLALIPLVWLLGRELFADRAEAGVGAAALTSVLSGVNGNFAIVANDGLMTVLCAGGLLAVARVMQRGFTTRRAVAVGVLVGAAVMTKLTALGLVPVVVVGGVIAARRHRDRGREVARCAAIAGGVAALIVAPWVVFNAVTYGGVTASAELDAITGSLQSDPPMNLSGLGIQLRQAGHGFWDQQLLDTAASRHAAIWFVFAGVVGVVACIRRREERLVLTWLFAAWPVVFAVMALVILGVSGGRSDIAGRHLYAALPALVVGVVAATFLVAGRWAATVLAIVCAVGLSFEARDAPGIMRAAYTQGVFGNLAPVVDRFYADRLIAGGRFVLDAPCPAVAARLVFDRAAPTIVVNGAASRPFASEHLPGGAVAARYAVTAAPRQVVVDVPADARVAASRVGPAHALYCVTENNDDARFAQNFRRGHPPLTAAQVAFAPRLWAVFGWAVAMAAAARNIGRWATRDSGANESHSFSSGSR
ncbi:MAG TPA: hypothetical protein VMZ22_00775 [Acidimicrobiales bacterium]|nr:hypothetical protein [Acidimicrobiales bacterium]